MAFRFVWFLVRIRPVHGVPRVFAHLESLIIPEFSDALNVPPFPFLLVSFAFLVSVQESIIVEALHFSLDTLLVLFHRQTGRGGNISKDGRLHLFLIALLWGQFAVEVVRIPDEERIMIDRPENIISITIHRRCYLAFGSSSEFLRFSPNFNLLSLKSSSSSLMLLLKTRHFAHHSTTPSHVLRRQRR